ncbi:galactokinase [Tunturiibacter gelidoferens]|uniref:Galactokinase n=2 Tax=Tunturiibacter TaxID=3154218 RepID=A0A7Y9NMK4_9BACT|nr:galactokinase [Edaphobacter lichenicola]MBB5339197.1 galactokinase [Edaphobacter lichenicola]NYF51545.1 galactokinase [Edaphobacter lichenicola]
MKTYNEDALRLHHQRFGHEGKLFAAPARVNLIGEHTDYTGGLVMPMAINFRTAAVLSKRDDQRAVFYSANYEEEASFEVASLERAPKGHWSDYPAGVLWSLQQQAIRVSGFNMTLAGDVPLGAGLSSSASVEVATALALLAHAGAALPLEKLANLCRRAENEYVGAKSGIMDQFVVAGAVTHRAMLLDCRSLTFELLPLPDQVRVVICNSMVKHAVATGEYGDRRDEVESGQSVLQRERPGVQLLRDATLEDLEACKTKMSAASFARCRHIITENQRVLDAREALLRDDMKRFGSIMVEAHKSMRDDFAASCKEVDTLVEIATQQPECFGARITGGGFGGCTVNVVRTEAAEQFVTTLKKQYAAKTGIEAQCFVSAPSDGALAMAANGGVL